VLLRGCSAEGALPAVAYVLDVSQGPVHHGISECVRHDGRVTKQPGQSRAADMGAQRGFIPDFTIGRREQFVQRRGEVMFAVRSACGSGARWRCTLPPAGRAVSLK
jgi:hypothetical protein